MTEPTDETQPHETPGAVPPAPEPSSTDAGFTSGASSPSAPPPSAPPPSAPPPSAPPASPPLRADPDRPPTAWREPPWIPPKPAKRRGPSPFAIIVGLIILAVGLYYFVDRTLGIDLPVVSWGNLWPVILIAIGGVILVRAWDRGR